MKACVRCLQCGFKAIREDRRSAEAAAVQHEYEQAFPKRGAGHETVVEEARA